MNRLIKRIDKKTKPLLDNIFVISLGMDFSRPFIAQLYSCKINVLNLCT